MTKFWGKYRLPTCLLHSDMHSLHHINTPHYSGAFFKTYEPTSTHDNHAKSVLYIRRSLLILYILWASTNV